MRPGTLRQILKDAGLTIEQLKVWSTHSDYEFRIIELDLFNEAAMLLGVVKFARLGEMPVKLRGELDYFAIRPETLGEIWNFRLQVTPVIKSPFVS